MGLGLGNTVSTPSIMRIHHRHRARLLQAWGNLCGMCHQAKMLEIHHKVRQEDEGSSDDHNLIPLCEECHQITLSPANKINLQSINLPGKTGAQTGARDSRS